QWPCPVSRSRGARSPAHAWRQRPPETRTRRPASQTCRVRPSRPAGRARHPWGPGSGARTGTHAPPSRRTEIPLSPVDPHPADASPPPPLQPRGQHPCRDRPSHPSRAPGPSGHRSLCAARRSLTSTARPPRGSSRQLTARTRRDQTLSSESLAPCGVNRLDRVQRRDCANAALDLLLRVIFRNRRLRRDRILIRVHDLVLANLIQREVLLLHVDRVATFKRREV